MARAEALAALALALAVAAACPSAAAAAAAAAAVAAGHSVTVDLATHTHRLNPLFMGCHSDTGYAEQPRGLYSQLILDESFEAEQHRSAFSSWQQVSSPGSAAVCTLDTDPAHAMNGFKSMKVVVTKGAAGVANRGSRAQGLFLEHGRSYEGYFFAAAESKATVRASLYNWNTNVTIAAATI